MKYNFNLKLYVLPKFTSKKQIPYSVPVKTIRIYPYIWTKIGCWIERKKVEVGAWYKEKHSHLLHWDESKAVPFWHTPFHFVGTGSIPSSLKLFESGHTPAIAIKSTVITYHHADTHIALTHTTHTHTHVALLCEATELE